MPTVTSMIDPSTIPLLTLPSVPFSERQGLPRCAAIYFVLNAHGGILYIGQSVNLAVRWMQHHRSADLAAQQAARITWLALEDVALLDAVESACIAYFEPPCNERAHSAQTHRRVDKSGYKAIMFRWPVEYIDHLRAMAAAEQRTMSAVALRLMREGMKARGITPSS